MKEQPDYISIPRKEFERLKADIADLHAFIEESSERHYKALEKIDELLIIIKEQNKIIQAFKNNSLPTKNSANSNLPPTKDLFRVDSRRSLRKKSNKKSGGQKGHKGHNLEFSSQPDKKIKLTPDKCFSCGKHLNLYAALLKDSRQVFDIPPIKPFVVQFDRYNIQCSCGCNNTPAFPQHVNAHVQYGPNVRSLVNYFSVRQFIPFKRLTEVLKDCFGISCSQGFIANSLNRTANKAKGVYEHIKNALQVSDWLGADETTIFTNGKKNTLWTYQNQNYTFLSVSNSRHQKHARQLFYHGFPNAVLSSDQYKVHINTKANAHQICWAHILRKIKFLKEIQNHYWLDKLTAIYSKANKLKKLHPQYSFNSDYTKNIETQLNQLLLRKLSAKTHPLIFKLQQSLKRHRPYLLTFLYHHNVPPDNNSSEQAIRNAKVKMKISGGFKSLQHAYAVMRSVIDTAIKNNKNILHIIRSIELKNSVSFV